MQVVEAIVPQKVTDGRAAVREGARTLGGGRRTVVRMPKCAPTASRRASRVVPGLQNQNRSLAISLKKLNLTLDNPLY
jgi:hypothetical protein